MSDGVVLASGVAAIGVDLSNPGPIGATTPSTGVFTTLAATANGTPAIYVGGTGATNELVRSNGSAFVFGAGVGSTSPWQFGPNSDIGFQRAAANSFQFGGTANTVAAASTRTEMNKPLTAIADNTATDFFTVTIPNAVHSAAIEVTLTGIAGAGGAVGAGEATAVNKYTISVARTAGANAVAVISTAFGTSTASVSGGTVLATTGTLGAVSGAVGAANTFTIKITVTHTLGSSTNHTAIGHAVLLNANTTGITIA